MIVARRFAAVIFAAILFVLLFRSRPADYRDTIQSLSQKVGLGEYVEDEEDVESTTSVKDQTTYADVEVNHDNAAPIDPLDASPFPKGKTKPPGQRYSRAFITGHLSSEDVTWLQEFVKSDPSVTPYVYAVDDPTAPLHLPKNKGHEAMYYLTYIIDHYDSLSDVNIFMHFHRIAWHTPELLNHDATEVLKRISSERVTREGYMNIRCHWNPGCPEHLHPGHSYRNNEKAEELAIARAWAEMFPGDPIPDALGTPCCAQFAVSKERIRSIPKAKFERYRNWLLRTEENDWISGRVFEYLWQKIFADVPKLCPNARVCYCDGYGICFTTSEVYNEWWEGYHYWLAATKELEKWDADAKVVEEVGDWKQANVEEMRLKIPLPGRNVELKKEIDERLQILVKLRTAAIKNGTDPEVRAMVAGREWKVGDGF